MKKFPNAFVIIIGVAFFAWILTYIIPQGSYERMVDEESGLARVVNDSYQSIDADYLSPFDFLLSIPQGIAGRAETIVLILLIGGCFYIIEKTGALNQGLGKLVSILEGKEVLALIIVSALFATGGATIGLQEEIVAMIPILLLFGRSLGYNTLATLCMSYGSAVLGSAFSPSNPFAVIIAQKEAGIPLLSGSELRLVVMLIAFTIWVLYLIRYTRKNKIEKVKMPPVEQSSSVRGQIILTLLCLTFGIVIYGVLQMDWGFNEMSACFFGLGITSGLIGKLGVNETGEMYIAGFKEMIFACIILGLANSISLILKQGMIIDTVVYGLFGPLQYLSPAASGVVMMFSQALLHFPLPSYSGQAVLTMPILVPLSDLIGLSRQTCVLAFQYGAVLADFITPTNGALMAVLAVCNVPYNKWVKFIFKPLFLLLAIGAIAIVSAVSIGYA